MRACTVRALEGTTAPVGASTGASVGDAVGLAVVTGAGDGGGAAPVGDVVGLTVVTGAGDGGGGAPVGDVVGLTVVTGAGDGGDGATVGAAVAGSSVHDDEVEVEVGPQASEAWSLRFCRRRRFTVSLTCSPCRCGSSSPLPRPFLTRCGTFQEVICRHMHGNRHTGPSGCEF